MIKTPPLPPGFVLEGSPQGSTYVDPADIRDEGNGLPPLPPGFELEAPPRPSFSASPNLTGVPVIGPMLGGMGFNGMPSVEIGGDDAQARYGAALAKVRQGQFADMPEDEWRRLALGEGRENLPIVGRLPGFAEPYDATELSQHSALFGLTDELEAGKAAIGAGVGQLFGGKGPGMGDVWSERLELEQARRDLGRQQQGALGTAAEVAGGLAAIGPKWGKPGLSAPVTANPVWQGFKNMSGAAAQGGAYGLGATDGDMGQRLAGAGTGAVLSAGASVIAPAAVRGVQGLARGAEQRAMTRAAVRGAPTAASIKAGSKASYRAAEATGAIVDRPALNLLRHDIRQMATAEGILSGKGKVASEFPKVKGAMKALEEFTSGPMSVRQAQILLKRFRMVAGSVDKDEARIGMKMIEQLDNFFQSLPQTAFAKGDGISAIQHWVAAKSQWARFMRTDAIEQALRHARFHKSGLAAGLRAQFKSIVTSNKKRRGFSSADLQSMERFVEGGSVEDFLEFISNGGSLTAGLAGHAVGGPVVGAVAAIAKPVAGALARRSLNSGARRTGDMIRAQLALPSGLPRLPAIPNGRVIDGFARRIGVGAGNPLMDDPRSALALRLGDGRGR